MKKYLLSWCLGFASLSAQSADTYPINPAIDVIHYQFRLRLSDQNDIIVGETTVEIQFTQANVRKFTLDLVKQMPGEGKGMTVAAITSQNQPVVFTHQGDQLTLQLPTSPASGERRRFRINYQGVPADGLIISTNRFGDRTFFGDNWPNRAHHWLPTVDHPSDKATCEFIVTAPSHYQVIANGLRTTLDTLSKEAIQTHWQEKVPIPTKVMVIGAARFAIQQTDTVKGKSIESWVFPQNQQAGFHDYALAAPILRVLEKRIGEFPYEKLANVQSKTRYGGMENASCIFYAENSVTGQRKSEALLAHEIAHQWFGDSVSELDWYHIWLSEGFATYFAQVYLEAAYGPQRLQTGMADSRKKVLSFYKNTPNAPLVDTTIQDLNKLLNPNAYEKGAWVLHMLRHSLGDDKFFAGIRRYYTLFRNKNVLSIDFQRVMEATSGQKLDSFFRQWLRQPGQPMLRGEWQYNKATRMLKVQFQQTQPGPLFQTPLEIGIYNTAGQLITLSTVELNKRENVFNLPLAVEPSSIVLDPNTVLLMEGDIQQKK